MTDEVEREVRAMLQDRASEMPAEFPAPPRLAERVARRRAAKLALVGTAVAVAIALVAAGVAATKKTDDKKPRVITSVPTTVAPRGGDALSFHEVFGSSPYERQATACRAAKPGAPSGAIVLPDRQKAACFILGPTLLTGHNISTADAVVNPTTAAWTINVHFANNDFVTKVAVPYVNRQIAIVLNGVVESAPMIYPGITGQDVTISGVFDAATAKRVASSLAPPSAHTSDTS